MVEQIEVALSDLERAGNKLTAVVNSMCTEQDLGHAEDDWLTARTCLLAVLNIHGIDGNRIAAALS